MVQPLGTTPPTPGTDVCAILVDGINDVGYTTLQEAFLAAVDGDVIYLLEDVTEAVSLSIGDKNLTFNTNGHILDIDSQALSVTNNNSVLITGGGTLVAVNIVVSYGALLQIDADVVITGDGTALWAIENAKVIVNGNITSSFIAVIARSGGSIIVNGNIAADGDGIAGGGAGTKVVINGNVNATRNGINGNPRGTMTVNGDITAGRIGVSAGPLINIEVNGDISAGVCGVFATDEADAIINGSITSEMSGVAVALGGKVTVNGKITAPSYIALLVGPSDDWGIIYLDGFSTLSDDTGYPLEALADPYLDYLAYWNNPSNWIFKTPAQHDAASAKSGYLQYSGGDPLSFVWVQGYLPNTGDSSTLVLLFALTFVVLGIGTLLLIRTKQRV